MSTYDLLPAILALGLACIAGGMIMAAWIIGTDRWAGR